MKASCWLPDANQRGASEHGVRYKVIAITEEDDDQRDFEMTVVTDDNQESGESFLMDDS